MCISRAQRGARRLVSTQKFMAECTEEIIEHQSSPSSVGPDFMTFSFNNNHRSPLVQYSEIFAKWWEKVQSLCFLPKTSWIIVAWVYFGHTLWCPLSSPLTPFIGFWFFWIVKPYSWRGRREKLEAHTSHSHGSQAAFTSDSGAPSRNPRRGLKTQSVPGRVRPEKPFCLLSPWPPPAYLHMWHKWCYKWSAW